MQILTSLVTSLLLLVINGDDQCGQQQSAGMQVDSQPKSVALVIGSTFCSYLVLSLHLLLQQQNNTVEHKKCTDLFWIIPYSCVPWWNVQFLYQSKQQIKVHNVLFVTQNLPFLR